jgi:hypothetical protein
MSPARTISAAVWGHGQMHFDTNRASSKKIVAFKGTIRKNLNTVGGLLIGSND